MKKGQVGQATIEYLMMILIVVTISIQVIKLFSGWAGSTFSSLSMTLTQNLTVGTCQKNCFFRNYANGVK
jgi:hypothetical protein